MWLKREIFYIYYNNFKNTTQGEYISSSLICAEVNESTDRGGKRIYGICFAPDYCSYF